MLHNNDSISRLMNVLVDSRDGSSRRLLLAPLACQSVVERNAGREDRCNTGATPLPEFVIPSGDALFTVKRLSRDAFTGSTAYFRQQCDDIAKTGASTSNSGSTSTVDNASVVNRTDEGYLLHDGLLFSSANSLTTIRNAIAPSSTAAATPMSDYENIMNDLIRARRKLLLNRAKLVPKIHTTMTTTTTAAAAVGETETSDNPDREPKGEEISDLISPAVAHFLIVPQSSKQTNSKSTAETIKTTETTQSSHIGEKDNITSGDENFTAAATFATSSSFQEEFASATSMRDYLASWRLHEFAKQHADDKVLIEWIESVVDEPSDLSSSLFEDMSSTSDRTILINIAATYLFLLTRERERRYEFQHLGLTEQAMRYTTPAATTSPQCEKYRLNVFAQLTNPRCSAFDECYSTVSRMYPELNVYSYDTNSLANGLALYVTSKYPSGVSHDIAYNMAIALVTLYIFAHGDRDIVMFLLRFITAIRFPGQFLKTVLLLQGTSDSGKSEFVSEVLRHVFSCTLTGHLSNATLRQGSKDEINTDLMSMMRSHLCQCDEPENINPELFKNLISTTMMKSRYFHQQQSQFLRNLAKLILTVNDAISLRSDAGVITRLKFCLRMIHRFKTLHARDHDSRIDFTKSNATPSISYQFATRCFAQGVSFPEFRIGIFLVMEHYGLDMCTYNNYTYTLYDTICSRLANIWLRDKRLKLHLSYLAKRNRAATPRDGNVRREAAMSEAMKNLNILRCNLLLFHKMLVFDLSDTISRKLTERLQRKCDYGVRRRHSSSSSSSQSSTLSDDITSDGDGNEDNNEAKRRRASSSEEDTLDGGEKSFARRSSSSFQRSIEVDVYDPATLVGGTMTYENEGEPFFDDSLEKDRDEGDEDENTGLRKKILNESRASARIARRAATVREKSIRIFRNATAQRLENPILIDELPDAMKHDARNLHVMIDPFELLQRRYRIEADSTITLQDTDLFRFLREFVEENGYSVSRTNFKDMVTKIKERIKTDYPQTFDNRTQSFHLVFIPMTLANNR